MKLSKLPVLVKTRVKILSIIFLFCFGNILFSFAQNPFITTWKTDNSGSSSSMEIKIPATGEYSYSWELIDDSSIFGSGTASDEYTISFPQPGIYSVSISPEGSNPFHQFSFGFSGDPKKLLSVDQWGDVSWSSFNGAFTETSNLIISATDSPDLSNVTDMSFAFFESGIDNEGNLNFWDVSTVNNFEAMFYGTTNFNQSLNEWNTENAEILKGMFAGSKIFNQPIHTWDVSKVTDMSFMFQDAQKFNQSLNDWNVSKVVDFSYMFSNTPVFNGELDQWNLESAETLEGMFTVAYGFDQPLNSWNVSNVTNLATMFSGAVRFNHSLHDWDVSNVENFWGLFSGSGFTHNLGEWNIAAATNLTNMLDNSSLSCENYSYTLELWKMNSELPENLEFGADGLEYSLEAGEFREYLINILGWTINGDVQGTCTILNIDDTDLNQVVIYPNPVQDNLNIASVEIGSSIFIYDIQGRILEQQTVSTSEFKLDFHNLKSGVYFLEVQYENQKIRKKIIKQ